MSLCKLYQAAVGKLQRLDGVALLALRVYLAPIFIIAGLNKYQSFADMVEWYGNAEWGLGLPMPALMVTLSIIAELGGGIALLFGVFTRIFSASLLVTMAVAAWTVHWQNGWFAIAPTDPDTSVAKVFSWFGLSAANDSLANSAEVGERLARAREILQEYGNYDWLTETGSFAVLNNGIEFATTYFVMLLVLLVFGAGFVSVDYWCAKLCCKDKR